jgi:Zn-dependent protease
MLASISSYLHLDTLLVRLSAFLIAMTLHDAAHACVAAMLGDRTAKEQGRLSLNPLAHLDALGLSMVLFGPYGWSKQISVNVDPNSSKPRLRHTLIYISGPLLNLLLVFISWWLYFSIPSFFDGGESTASMEMWRVFLQYCVIVNLMVFIIHLLPLYPLDGWHIVEGLVPPTKEGWFKRNERYGLIVLLVLMVTPIGQWLLAHLYPKAAQLVMNIFSL